MPDDAHDPNPSRRDAAGPEAPLRFAWVRDDPEARIGLRGGRFTRVHSAAWLLAAAALTVAFYGLLALLPPQRLVDIFTQRGPVQYVIVMFFFWTGLMLAIKHAKIALQRRALGLTELVPADPEFVLSPGTVAGVLGRLRAACGDPHRFFLFNRIELALSNLANMGRVSDVDEVLRSQAADDEEVMESSYTLIKGLIWAMPVLGFIGTVQGLSVALGEFGTVLEASADLGEVRPALQEVTAGLSTAFDTTFVALVAALLIQLLMTVTHKREEDLLDACSEYCKRHVVGRLRLMPFDARGVAR